MKTTALKRLTRTPPKNGLGLAGSEDNPEDPRYIRITDIGDDGQLRKDTFASQPRDIAVSSQVIPGDVLIASVASVGKSYLHRDEGEFCFAGYLSRVRPKPDELLPEYLFYWTQSGHYWDQIRRGTVSSTIENFSAGKIGALRIPVLPLWEQRVISDYLNQETAEIDTFIAELQALLELSTEHLDSSWDTKFRDLCARHPEVKLRRVLSSLVDGPFGSALTSASYAEEGSPVVRLGNIRRNSFVTEPRVYVPTDYAAQLASHDARPGDVVIAGLGDDNFPLGRAAVIPPHFGRGIVKADCYRARTSERISATYLAWALSSPTMNAAFQVMGRGTTRARLNLSIVSATTIPLPDRKSQEEVVQAHEAESRAHDSLVEFVNRAVALARERRAALISAAVTGQIDVTQKHRPVAEQLEDEVKQLS